MRKLEELLRNAVELQASDIFIVSGACVSCKLKRDILPLDSEPVLPASAESLIREIYAFAQRDMDKLRLTGDDDFSFALAGLARFRVSTYKQRGSLAAVIRVISFGIPDYRALSIPEEVMAIADRQSGMVLVTGPAGCGKSTTQACIINRINENRACHIITLEEPIEFLHRDKKSIISQREVGLDSENYVTALRSSLRQSPDVILLGEMRDRETTQIALTAAETGHLVISTLHTLGAVETISRVIDVFPPAQQQQIRIQLSMLLQSVVSQLLIPTVDGALLPVFEIMHLSNAIRNMIRESKIHQIASSIAAGTAAGMISMDASILKLVREKRVSPEVALRFASNPDLMKKHLSTASS
jgi:twitching motility protein PilT